jgi:hypothetical protein
MTDIFNPINLGHFHHCISLSKVPYGLNFKDICEIRLCEDYPTTVPANSSYAPHPEQFSVKFRKWTLTVHLDFTKYSEQYKLTKNVRINSKNARII